MLIFEYPVSLANIENTGREFKRASGHVVMFHIKKKRFQQVPNL